jgi:hypothetical protein
MFDGSQAIITGATTERVGRKFKYPILQDELRRGATLIGHLNPNCEDRQGLVALKAIRVRIGGETIGRGVNSSIQGALVCANESVANYRNGLGLETVSRADHGVLETALDGLLDNCGSFSIEKADRGDIESNAAVLTLMDFDMEAGGAEQVGEPIRADSLDEALEIVSSRIPQRTTGTSTS